MITLLAFWYISQDKKIYLITAANREAANVKWDTMTGKASILLSAPAVKCTRCGRYMPPVAGYIVGGEYMDTKPCANAEHQGYMPEYDVMPEVQLNSAVGESATQVKYSRNVQG